MIIGLISDTHGKVRNGVFEALEGVERILHAGDVGPASVLVELEAIAPVTAVHGNTDGWDVREHTNGDERLELEGRVVVLTHGHLLGSPNPANLRATHPNADIIVYGHTHRPAVDRHDGALIINPGAAGPARFKLKPSVALLELRDGREDVRLIELSDNGKAKE